MRTSRILAPAATAAALVALLAGCSATNGDHSAPSATASASASASKSKVMADSDVRVPDKKVDGKCIDGAAIIDQSGADVTLEGACQKVTVSGNDSVVHLGDVDELIVESAISRITVGTAGTITLSGNANDVLYSGDAPSKVDDRGAQNVVVKDGK
ncbi:DUF3060 domain-containing protein [Curtobacterium luteum]|uniref:DUF3060 domain-containing protein n=1 Tax=Curtobacterium luteum TaxID=33881 RepID=UPI0038284FD8